MLPITWYILAGPVPGLNASRMTSRSPASASIPVLRLIGIKIIPSGILNGISGFSFRAAAINSPKIGAASELPVPLYPNGAGLS